MYSGGHPLTGFGACILDAEGLRLSAEEKTFFADADPFAKAIVEATTHYRDPQILAEISQNLGEPMVGISVSSLAEGETLADRGW